MDLTGQVKRARSRGASLIAITTADQPAAAELVATAVNGSGAAVVGWDSVRGPYALNRAGEAAVQQLCAGLDPSALTDAPTALGLARSGLPTGVVFVVANAHRLVEGTDALRCLQAIGNLRDPFGSTGRTLVLLAPTWTSPVELGSDVLVLDDPLPTEAEREELARKVLDDAARGGAEIADVDSAVAEAVRLTRGLSRYAVQQTVSLSLERRGLDATQLQSRFVAAVNQTPGLTFEPEPVPIDAIGGLGNFKAFAQAVAGGRSKPRAVVFVDEIEKALAGSSGASADSSGTSQGILGALLTWMEDHSASGIVALGPPGSGKSMSAKALGGVLGVPTIRLDIGALKGSLVGQSEANTRAALKALESLAGSTFWVATCNSVNLPPELRRRFKQGVWFFDLPSREERASIWTLYLEKLGLDASQPRPADEGWTGAEIKACCESAWSLSIPLTVAAQWIVPVAKSAAEQIRSLRQNASGRYVSASRPGTYTYTEITAVAPTGATSRSITFEEA